MIEVPMSDSRSDRDHERPGPDRERPSLRVINAVVERDLDSGLYVGYVPGWPGAHSQGVSLDELHDRLEEVVAMLLEDGRVPRASEFVGVQTIRVA